MCATVHTTLKATPGSLVYQRDMILNIPVVADLLDITAWRQQLIDERTMAENQKQISHDYQPNDQVLVLAYKPDKLEPRSRGPYRILHTHVNGTVMICTVRLSQNKSTFTIFDPIGSEVFILHHKVFPHTHECRTHP